MALFGCAMLLFEFLVGPAQINGAGSWRSRSSVTPSSAALLWMQQVASTRALSFVAFKGPRDGRLLASVQLDLPDHSAIVLHRRTAYLEIEGENHGEYYGLVLLAQCGMFFLALRQRPGDHLYRSRADGAVLLHHGRVPPNERRSNEAR